MKIIFLDMDGVLCTFRSHFSQGCNAPNGIMHGLDREAIGLMNALALGVPGTQVQFVLISTWRLEQHPVGRGGRAQLEEHLRAYGWAGQFHEDWKTEALNCGSETVRGQEVAKWLESHPDIGSYVIVDDGEHFTDVQRENHVRPDYANGLLWADFKRAVKILHGIEQGLP